MVLHFFLNKKWGSCERVDILTFKLYNIDREEMSQTCRHDFIRYFIVILLSHLRQAPMSNLTNLVFLRKQCRTSCHLDMQPTESLSFMKAKTYVSAEAVCRLHWLSYHYLYQLEYFLENHFKSSVIVKNSSPHRLSVDSWPTVGRQSTDSWPTVGQLSVDSLPRVFSIVVTICR